MIASLYALNFYLQWVVWTPTSTSAPYPRLRWMLPPTWPECPYKYQHTGTYSKYKWSPISQTQWPHPYRLLYGWHYHGHSRWSQVSVPSLWCNRTSTQVALYLVNQQIKIFSQHQENPFWGGQLNLNQLITGVEGVCGIRHSNPTRKQVP